MGTMQGRVASAFLGAPGTLRKDNQTSLEFTFDGIVGDRHRGLTRKAWALTDKQPEGTERRNERQWSAVAQEDLDRVSSELDLETPLTAGDVAVNLSISGVPDFSRLPRGTTLVFEGGVVLMVEEYNPPCSRMSKHLSETLTAASGSPIADDAFISASKFSRGLVGVVEVPGFLAPGESIEVYPERLPKWLRD
jgi:MOSC domain-containing protein YiiM